MNLCRAEAGDKAYSKDESRGYASDRAARDMLVDSFVERSFLMSIAARRGIRRGLFASDIPNVWIKSNSTIDDTDTVDLNHFMSHTYPNRILNIRSDNSPSSLSAEGIELKRKLVACVPYYFSFVEFCPYISSLLDALLCFHDLPETVSIVSRFICRMKLHEPRLFMFCKWQSFRQFVGNTFSFALKQIPRADKIDFLQAWLADHLADGGYRLLPFGLFVRMSGIVLFEGCKVIARYILAALKLAIANPQVTISDAPDLDRLVSQVALRSGKKLAILAFKLRLSFKMDADLPDLNREKFEFFDTSETYEGYMEVAKSFDPMLVTRRYGTVFKSKTDGFALRLFQVKFRDAENFIVLVTTKHFFRGFYLVNEIRYVFDDRKAIMAIGKEQAAKFVDGRFFIGGLLTIDNDMNEVAGAAIPISGQILDLELIIVN